MRLYLYYILHSFVNQIRKMFKTWVFVLIIVCGLLGGVVGLTVGLLTEPTDEPEEIAIEIPDEEIPYEILPDAGDVSHMDIFEIGAGGIVLLFAGASLLAADRAAGSFFQPADVNLLFAAPLRPQSVLMFRVATQLGTSLMSSIYFAIQLPNLVRDLGVSGIGTLMIALAWVLTLLWSNLLQVVIYLFVIGNPKRKNMIRNGCYGIAILAVLGGIAYATIHHEQGLASFVRYLNHPISRWIPVWGWLKGMAVYGAKGNIPMALSLGGLCVIAGIGTLVGIYRMKVDFYEDAMAKSQERVLIQEKANNQGLVFSLGEKHKTVEKKGVSLQGKGANVFFFKTLFVRFRTAPMKYWTKTAETYLVVAVLTAVLCRYLLEVTIYIPVACVLALFVFYRSFGNPLKQDTETDFFRLIPEPTWKKLMYSVLGGSVNCALDLIAGSLAAAIFLHPKPWEIPVYIIILASIDYYATAIGAFIELIFPKDTGKGLKQTVQILFLYFGALPVVGVFALASMFTNMFVAILSLVALDLAIGTLFVWLCGRNISPANRYRVEYTGLDKNGRKQARRDFSSIGFSLLVISALVLLFVMVIAASAREAILTNPWMQWFANFMPLYVAVPLGVMTLRDIPKTRKEKKKLSIKDYLSLMAISLFLILFFNYVGIGILYVIELIGKDAVNTGNALDEIVIDNSIALRILYMVILAPIMEEYLFRHQFISRTRIYGEYNAIVMSSLAFGLFHGNLSQFFYATALGLLFGYVYVRTNDVKYTIGLHMFVNLVGAIILPETTGSIEYVVLTVVFGIAIIGAILMYRYRNRVKFEPTLAEIPKGDRLKLIYCNPGMILFLLFCLVEIGISLFLM